MGIETESFKGKIWSSNKFLKKQTSQLACPPQAQNILDPPPPPSPRFELPSKFLPPLSRPQESFSTKKRLPSAFIFNCFFFYSEQSEVKDPGTTFFSGCRIQNEGNVFFWVAQFLSLYSAKLIKAKVCYYDKGFFFSKDLLLFLTKKIKKNIFSIFFFFHNFFN